MNKSMEKVTQILEKALKDEGYEIKRYSKSKKYSCSSYDCLCLKAPDGTYSEVTLSELVDRVNPYTQKMEKASEKFEIM